MFCVECGLEKDIYKNGVCLDCYLKSNKFTSGPKVMDIYSCSNCNSYKYRNMWLSESFEEVLKRHIKDSFTINNELKNVDIQTNCNKQKKSTECTVTITGKISDKTISEEHLIVLRNKSELCPTCSKQFGGYYEAILQIRADKRKLSKVELNTIHKDVEKQVNEIQSKGNKALFITDYGEEHGGLDFFLSEKGSALSIAKKIFEKYGGELKKSAKNYGMKDSKQLYRVTYLIRLPSFQINDIIQFNKSYYIIESIHGNTVYLQNISDWNEKIVELREIKNSSIVDGKELIKDFIFVSQSNDYIQLMNPKTYDILEVKKPRDIKFNSETIRIIKINDSIFLYPNKKEK